jgi:hypothetical protein
MARQAYAHDAEVVLHPGGSPNALGGAITVALCGHWNHKPPCRLAPHYVAHSVDDETVTLRILFATEPANEQHVRALIGEALGTGALTGPDGGLTTWQVKSACASAVRPEEENHAAGLITA